MVPVRPTTQAQKTSSTYKSKGRRRKIESCPPPRTTFTLKSAGRKPKTKLDHQYCIRYKRFQRSQYVRSTARREPLTFKNKDLFERQLCPTANTMSRLLCRRHTHPGSVAPPQKPRHLTRSALHARRRLCPRTNSPVKATHPHWMTCLVLAVAFRKLPWAKEESKETCV